MASNLRRGQLLKRDFQENVLQENNFPVVVSNLSLMVIFQSVLERIWFGKLSVMVWTTGCGLFWVWGGEEESAAHYVPGCVGYVKQGRGVNLIINVLRASRLTG